MHFLQILPIAPVENQKSYLYCHMTAGHHKINLVTSRQSKHHPTDTSKQKYGQTTFCTIQNSILHPTKSCSVTLVNLVSKNWSKGPATLSCHESRADQSFCSITSPQKK
uniref:Uncharacterized protein n=1 Tax=Rhizophora mucronata TaxID=61149 RepID=A0A2P2QSB3_RHIMU